MLQFSGIVCVVLASLSLGHAYRFSTPTMSLAGRSSFLGEKDLPYLQSCLRLSVDSCKKCLKDEQKLIEVEFPANTISDLSVTQTLDTTRVFVREFVKTWEDLGSDLWVVFPDNKECSLARDAKGWGDSVPFTMTSIEGAMKAPADKTCQLYVVVNPGFNVEEWIDIPKILQDRDAPMIVVNGNLDRLRNGYYPKWIYPKLTKTTETFYSKATQAFFISPVAVEGSRLGAWTGRVYPGNWEILVKNSNLGGKGAKDGFDVVHESETQPDAKFTWKTAKSEYNVRRGKTGWL